MPVKEMVGRNTLSEGSSEHISPKDDGLENVLNTIKELNSRLQGEGDDVEPLNDIFEDRNMQALIKIHEKVRPLDERKTTEPASKNSLQIVNEVTRIQMQPTPELVELSVLLRRSPHMMALLQCHDQVACKDFEPELPDADTNDSLMGDEEESMKVVRLVKGDEPLGATIAHDELTGNIVIARILKGGAADRSGLIHVDDILVELNKVPVRGKKPEDLIRLLADFRGPLTFRLIPGEGPAKEEEEPPMFVRAKFNYDPSRDRLIPCAEAGLKFKKNDVLRIVSRDDESWWQAALVDEGIHATFSNKDVVSEGSYQRRPRSKRAGLIPSAKLQTRRETLRRQAVIRNHNNNAVKGSSASLTSRDQREKRSAWTLLRQSFRRSNRRLDRSTPSPEPRVLQTPVVPEMDPPTILAYEEVVLLAPASEVPREERFFRPIVLVGPQGVGRNELKDRLIGSNPTHYGVPVPHTSRPKLEDEEDAKDYHFVTRIFMENGIRDNMFLEYGEYKGNLYGTSLEAVREVIKNHQVCVLTPYPQALKVLRTEELKPFVIYVKPPAIENLCDESGNLGTRAKLTIDRDMSVPYSTQELQDLVNRGNKMESTFGDLFDYIVVNNGLDRAFAEVKQVAFAAENEPQWVPKNWTAGNTT